MAEAGGALPQPGGAGREETAMAGWTRLVAALARRRRTGTPADAPVRAEPAGRPPGAGALGGGRSAGTADGPRPFPAPHPARAVPVPVVPADQWQARRTPQLLYARMSNAERARLLRQRPDCELCVRRESAAVDHDAGTGRVRGVLCRSCNSWLGSMEAALCVPRNRMQTQAAYLHWRFEAGGTAALAWYRGELSYLGLSEQEFADGLRRVRRLLAVPCVYWTDDGQPPSRDTQWTKTGPLQDAEEADRHHRRLRHALGDGNVVVTAFEPDDGVNSPAPRGLVKPFTGDACSVYGYRA
ncbi:endonuclease domain-containing protein [Streptomyces griseofuscus]|uniref:endonuclease domain-containing protein n=2 Tax=Streptomycetaceae TaxID=2062 RepID=UPI0005658DD6